MKRYPGSYTLSSAYAEDAYVIYQHIALLDSDIGKAGPVGE